MSSTREQDSWRCWSCSGLPLTWARPCWRDAPTGHAGCCASGSTFCRVAVWSSRWCAMAGRRARQPASDVGQALLARRPDRARWLLRQWVDLLPRGGVVIEVVCHGGPEGTPASLGHAARLLGLATESELPAVLTAAVRHADPGGAVTVDVLDAARRLVPLDTRHLDRVTTAGHLASSAQMYAVARDVARASGAGVSGGGSGERDRARRLMADTMALAQACALDSRTDLGIGSVHLPEPSALGIAPDESPQEVLAARCLGAIATRYGGAGDAELSAVASRLEDELRVIAGLGYPCP